MIRKRKETKILEEYLKRDDLLDEDEQAEVVALLRDEVVLQQRLWCNIFTALSGVLALAYICLGLSEMRSPGGMQHHAAFASTLSTWGIAFGEVFSGACIMLTGSAITRHVDWQAGRRRQPISAWFSAAPLALGLGLSIFWTQALIGAVKVGSIERNWWKYVWLPAAPLLFALTGKYVTKLSEESSKGVQGLQSQMYSFKKV